tara:strand:- start:53 stop:430 length:378 start_codon:yes stop_codon:yes gene_type:complete
MNNKEYKVIKENWDQFVNEEEQINEVQLPGMNFILENLDHIADFFDFLAKVTNQPKIKAAADACRVVDAGMKNLQKEHPALYKVLQAGDIAGMVKGKAANKAITAIRSAFGAGRDQLKQIPDKES